MGLEIFEFQRAWALKLSLNLGKKLKMWSIKQEEGALKHRAEQHCSLSETTRIAYPTSTRRNRLGSPIILEKTTQRVSIKPKIAHTLLPIFPFPLDSIFWFSSSSHFDFQGKSLGSFLVGAIVTGAS